MKKEEQREKSAWVLAVAAVLSVVIYPCMFIYFTNAGEATLLGTLPICLAISAVALLIFFIMSYVEKSVEKGAIIACLLALFFLNFALIEKVIILIFPMLYYWHIVLLLLLITAIVACIVKWYCSQSLSRTICGVIALVFFALTLVNGLTAIPTLINKMSAQQKKTSAIGVTDQAQKRPNIYVGVFDEYGGMENLEYYCAYDNTPFYKQLEDLKFNVSPNTHNEAYQTLAVLGNFVNLDYLTAPSYYDETVTIEQMQKAFKSPALFDILLKGNYALNIADSSKLFDVSKAKYVYETSFMDVGNTPTYFILRNTAIYPFYRTFSSEAMTDILNEFEYLKNSTRLQDSNLFTLAYFNFPHLPWMVDENGNPIDDSQADNWRNPNAYLGQLKYCNKKIVETVQEIIKKDPNGIIFLLSDHGFRYGYHVEALYNIPMKDKNLEERYMTNTLSAVYYQGKPLDIENEAIVNVMRKILNETLSTDMPMIAMPDYAPIMTERKN
ncbi:MAG: hypothetical protein RSF73_09225 [Ruthenibacterium sp.]